MNSIEFRAEGRGSFPIDMLRYDNCRPRSEADSATISASYFPRASKRTFFVTLVGSRRPTEGRWESFGWKISRILALS